MNKISILESILYALGSKGIELTEIKKLMEIQIDEIKTLLKQLKEKYLSENSGIDLFQFGKKFYLGTKKENSEILKKIIFNKTKNPISTSLLESLAIIAYNQPCSRNKIQSIRGSDPTYALDKLELLELITKKSENNLPGSPTMYQVTDKFFNLFGIKNLSELPKLEEIEFDNVYDISFFDSGRNIE